MRTHHPYIDTPYFVRLFDLILQPFAYLVSFVFIEGSRLKAQGSRLKAQGSRLKAQGSRLKAILVY